MISAWDVFWRVMCRFEAGKRAEKISYPQQPTPADLDAAARAFWIEAEKAHVAKHAERNG